MKKILLYILVSIIAIALISFLLTYPSYHKQIRSTNEKINDESRILETKLGTIEYALKGEGIPVLLIHGAGGGFDQGLWLGDICLEDDYLFIAPSKFGYLGSDIPHNYSARLQAEQYRILLNHLNMEKVVVVGVSAGGPSAMEFASNYPERTDTLILLSAVSMPPNQNDKDQFSIKVIQQIQKSDYAYWLFTKAFRTQMLSLLGIPSTDYKKFTLEQKSLAQEMLDVMHPMSARYEGTLLDGKIIKDFQIPENISVPTLIIHSKNDGLVSYSHAEYANSEIKGSKIILYEKGGHGALSELEDVRKQIGMFLK